MTRAKIFGMVFGVLFLSGIASACPNCPFGDPHATFTLSEEGDALVLTSTVMGCQAHVKAHQEKVRSEIEKGLKGEGCERCPFSVKGIEAQVENTNNGVKVTVTGSKDALKEFKKRFEAKEQHKREGGGCGCKHGSALKFDREEKSHSCGD